VPDDFRFVRLTETPTVEELQSRVDEYLTPNTELYVTEPVSAVAEPGKEIVALVCGIPVCSEFTDGMEEAADVLGWNITRVDLGVSPEEFAAAYDRAIELEPDMVIGSGLSRELFDEQLKTLGEMGIPVIQWSAGAETGDGITWVMTDAGLYEDSGYMYAEFVGADSGGDGKAVLYTVPQYINSTIMLQAMQEYLPTVCPDCSAEYVEVGVGDIGANMVSRATAYLQNNPDTDYIFCSFADLCSGVGQALQDAGFNDVKILTRDGGATTHQNIVDGLEYAALPLPTYQTGWQIIDAAQRIFNDDDLTATRYAPMQIVTAEQIEDPSDPDVGAVDGFRDIYLNLWQQS
jgi:ribose transport system substrate-binding protein